MQQKLLFTLSLVALFFSPLLPTPLMIFAPYLMWTLMHRSLKHLLWTSLLCGVIVDLFQSSSLFGLYALEYVMVSALLHHQKRWFFSDKLLSLSLFVTLFSFLVSILHVFFLSLQQVSLAWSTTTLLIDFLVMPLCDGFYAFILFTIPLLIYQYIKQKGFHFLFIRKLN